MASCCRQRRRKSEPLPESREFKVLTPDHVTEVRQLIKEQKQRDKENKKRRKIAIALRKRFEAGDDTTEADHENEDRVSELSSEDAESVDEEEAAKNKEDTKKDKENKRVEKIGVNKRMEAGKKLSPKYAADFQKHLAGQPLIDIDPFYKEKEVFIVVGRDHTVFRFSAHDGLFCLSPFNPVRRLAISTLVHPIFNMIVMLTILTNCIFMARAKEIQAVEYLFTAIYTFEFLTKMLARGMILSEFTYLRDAWNWLDFFVIMLAYVMLVVDGVGGGGEEGEGGGGGGSEALGNVAVLRTFRVLRALKTVAVVPGLKTIVGALMEAVIKMRDVAILTIFMLSIFSLVGLQLYMGSLNYKCIKSFPSNLSDDDKVDWKNNTENLQSVLIDDYLICGKAPGAGKCDVDNGYECMEDVMSNPNFGYTSWDNFGSCMLNAFRIMNQDYWENLYFITIRANGPFHFFFFVFFILLGSFYLINLILAIVAMAYNEQQERDRSELEAEANEKLESDEAEAQKHANAAEDKWPMDKVMLPYADTADEFESCQSLYTTSIRNRVDPKGVQEIREMMDNTSRAPTKNEQNATKSELLKARFRQIFCSWSCCPGFLVTQKYLDLFINDAFMEVFIMLAILCNTTFMAIEHHEQSKSIEKTLTNGNYVFTSIFALECLFKLIALGPVKYFREAWNSFDFAVVVVSLVELYLATTPIEFSGFRVLRAFRLLRVLKLAKSWKTLNSLMMIVAKSLGALGNLTFILGIVVFIFAVMGKQLFSVKYNENAGVFTEELFDNGIEEDRLERIPRWNFKNFLHAFMIVFRVLCGEWIQSMWDCMRAGQEYFCVPFFLLTLVVGNLVVLNLFLVLLLSSFSSDALDKKESDDEVDKMTEAKGRTVRLFKYIKKSIINRCCTWRQQVAAKSANAVELTDIKVTGNGTNGLSSKVNYADDMEGDADGQSSSKILTLLPLFDDDYDGQAERETSMEKLEHYSASSCESLDDAEALVPKSDTDTKNLKLTKLDVDEGPPDGYKSTVVEYETLPSPCCFLIKSNKLETILNSHLREKFWALRCFAFRLVEHKYFEGFIIVCILLSSMSLALEDIYLKDRVVLKLILNYMDKIFSGIFICEMLLKWLAFGFHKYFTDAWCWLDFVIVGISISGLIMESLGLGDISAFKAMRTLRALRPLRAVSRWEGMRVVVNALIQAVPSISNVLLVIMIFWLIFAIMGVNFFAGKFYKCVDAEGRFLHVYYREMNGTNSTYNYVKEVLGVGVKADCEAREHLGYKWENSKINFDNVPRAYLALLQVATYKGWIEIMADATDATKVDQNPIYESQAMYYLYFVLFIVLGSFFTLNLFIGVIIENFNAQKKKAGGSLEMFMTDDQKKYYNAMKKLSTSGPAKATPRPKWAPQAAIFDFTMNQKFDVVIMIFILLNMITMCAEHSGQSEDFSEILASVNIVFIVVFTLEAALKLIALRHHYFTVPWNVFDFVVVLFSILALAFQDTIKEVLDLSPTVLRVVRVFRVGRILRLVKSAKGIRTLLFSLLVSLPALFNIGLLLFLVMFIYATFGMSFFAHVQKTVVGVDEVFNFETFFRALITLFQCTTSAGWNGVLDAITNKEGCDENMKPTNCGNPTLGVAYMVTYLLFTFLVIINMYIAVILENFSQATEDVQQGITQDDIDMYYEVWGTYDPKATKYIQADMLFDLVDELEEPLRVPKPNYFRLVMTDIQVCVGDKIHCSDLLDMLTRLFLKQDLDSAADENMPQTDIKEKNCANYRPLYGLLERQRHKWAARFIWRRYLAYRAAKAEPLFIEDSPASTPQLSIENEVEPK